MKRARIEGWWAKRKAGGAFFVVVGDLRNASRCLSSGGWVDGPSALGRFRSALVKLAS
jgi:hypothetical protein